MRKLFVFLMASASAQFLEKEEPTCFYCSDHKTDLSLKNQYDFDIKDDCQDVCDGNQKVQLDTQDDCKAFVQNYTSNAEIVNHYILDDRVKTCFSFDPRNAERYPLFPFLHESDQNENQKRQLARKFTCNDLGDWCFQCEGMSAGICNWGGLGKCTTAPLDQNRQKNYATNQWYERFDKCDKKAEQGLCIKNLNVNQTQFNFTMNSNPLGLPKQPPTKDAQGNTLVTGMPAGYFCQWIWDKDESKDLDWVLNVIRIHSNETRERIYIRTYNEDGRPMTAFTDKYLRDKSYRYKTDEELGLQFKSYAFVELKSYVSRVEIFAQNLQFFSEDWTFRIIVEEQEDTTSVVSIVMITISACLFCVLLSICFSRCYFNNRDDEAIDWQQFESPDPNWDQDQLRIYNIRRLEVQLDMMDQDGLDPEHRQNEDETVQRDQLQRQLQQLQVQNAREFISALEDLKMDSKTQKHTTQDCTICLMVMEEGEDIKRIPTCMHSFHPNCLRKWFEEKISEDVQKCPQCNQSLKTYKMKEAKLVNQQSMMIEPKLKGNNPQGSRVSNAGEMQDMTGQKMQMESMSGDSDSSESGYQAYAANDKNKKYEP